MKTVFAIVAAIATASATAGEEGTASVLVNQPTPATSAVAAQPCETAKEVRLTTWQARRLARQAERQEVRDCLDCCNGKCPGKKDCRPTAIVVTRGRKTCDCGCN